MISLSNSVHKRVIQIKTAEFFAEKQLNTDASAEETLDGLMEKIADAKAKLEEIKQEQYRIIEEGKARIIEEKQQWQEEKIRLVEEAKKEGYQAGFQLGKEESRKEYERLLTQANEIVEKAQADYYRTVAKHEDTILHLATGIAEKILKKKLSEDPAHFLPLVQSALKEMREQGVVKIYVHPSKYKAVLENKEELQELLEHDAKLSIYIKEDLSEDGCLIEHPFGRLDAGVDTQLDQIREMLEQLQQENRE